MSAQTDMTGGVYMTEENHQSHLVRLDVCVCVCVCVVVIK